MTLESFAKWWIVVVMILHILATVAMIDKPRTRVKPTSAAVGIFTAIFWGLYITAIIVFWETS